jgi:TonB family protein
MPIFLAYAEPPAAAVASTPKVLTQVQWLQLPSADDLARYYPVEAAKSRVEGRSTVRCQVNAEGRLVDCAVESEDPLGAGFGAAAVDLVTFFFKMQPNTKYGVPVAGGTVRIPIRFTLPPAPPSQAASESTSFALTTSGPKAFKWLEKPDAYAMTIAMVRYSSVREGRVVLFCQAAATGQLAGCRVDSETPAKVGLRNSALSLVYAFRMAPTTADGGSVAGGTLSIPLHFYSP